MAQSNAARTLISFCMNLSSMALVAMLVMQLVCCVRFTFFFLLVTGFSWDAGGVLVSWKTKEFASQRGEEHLRRTLLLVWCKDRDRNGSEDGARDCRHVCQVWGAWGVPCDQPNAAPRVTDAKTGGAALGHIVLSLLFLLAVERMLEPLLRLKT
jgi:hypothetical protein